MNKSSHNQRIAVLGATGYIGGRLVSRLLNQGYTVRTISRSRLKLSARPWVEHPNIELCECNVLSIAELTTALQGCDVVYYLVHSMNPQTKDFAKTDRLAAYNLIEAAATMGVKRIIYLGGLGENKKDLSEHLKSRSEVAQILAQGTVPVTVLRAAMIIGSGSASFEILRYLVERLPIMLTPKWIRIKCQPIAVRNVIAYLIGCLDCPETINQTFDIGGPDIVSYETLFHLYAEAAHLKKRWLIPIPLLSIQLSAHWIHLITPIPKTLARPLAEGLKNPVICENNTIQQLIPQPLISCKEAIALALERTQHNEVESHWLDAGDFPTEEWIYPGDSSWAGGTVYQDKRQMILEKSPTDLWQPIIGLGGAHGWYYGKWLWQIRGLLDLCFGGDGFARGRRDRDKLQVGDFLDCWRVVKVVEHQLLILKADMRLPGDAYLEFRIDALNDTTSALTQTARFVPKGLLGLLYWWAVTPAHNFVFDGMLRGIAHSLGLSIKQKIKCID